MSSKNTLRTLKDLFKGYLRETSPPIEVVSTKTLKQEVIKWIKFLESDAYWKSNLITSDPNEVANWIKHFFNVSEEDLK